MLIYFICLLQALIPDLTFRFYFIYTGHNCITEPASLDLLVLRTFLVTALLALNNLRGDPIEKGSGALGFARYKQYISWVHNRLGKDVRKVIPACTMKEIRKNYPSKDGKYIPVMESTKDENRIGNGKECV